MSRRPFRRRVRPCYRVLYKLLALKIQSEIIAALRIVRLVEVAWADGSLDEKERKAVG